MTNTYIKPDIDVLAMVTEPLMQQSKWGEKEEGSDIKIQPGGDGSELDAKENNFGWDYDYGYDDDYEDY